MQRPTYHESSTNVPRNLLPAYLACAQERPIFRQETGQPHPASRQREMIQEVMTELERALANDAQRHLLEIFDAAAQRLTIEPARAARQLVALIRGTRADQPVRRDLILNNIAYQSLIWLIRTRAKVEHHFHFSGNIDPAFGPLAGGDNDDDGTRPMALFAEQKRRIDAAVHTPELFLACMEHVVSNAFSDGCTQLELRFNPFGKPYCSDERQLLERLHESLCRLEESFAEVVGCGHAVRFVFSINRVYGSEFAREALSRVERVLGSASDGLRKRVYGLDLSGMESDAFPPSRWKPAFRQAAELGLAAIVHLGDATHTDLPSIPAHLDYVESSLDCLEPLERVGHAIVLSPWVERNGGVLVDARDHLPRILGLLQRIAGSQIAIETAPSPTLLGVRRHLHRAFFWRQLGFPLSVIPVADEIFQHHVTLSMWVADLLLFGPAGSGSWTWPEVFGPLQPAESFLLRDAKTLRDGTALGETGHVTNVP